MVDRHPTLLHEFFRMALAQGIGQKPAHTGQDNILYHMSRFEARHHRSPPRLFHRRSQEEIIPQIGRERIGVTDPFRGLKLRHLYDTVA
jgi:hypothetical protein